MKKGVLKIVAVIMVGLMALSSCTQTTCPTYAKELPKEKSADSRG